MIYIFSLLFLIAMPIKTAVKLGYGNIYILILVRYVYIK